MQNKERFIVITDALSCQKDILAIAKKQGYTDDEFTRLALRLRYFEKPDYRKALDDYVEEEDCKSQE